MNFIFICFLSIFVLLASFGWSIKVSRINSTLSILFITFYSTFIGFRSSISGSDTLSYINYFEDIKHGNSPAFGFEIGFELLTRFFVLFDRVDIYIFFLTFSQMLLVYVAACTLKLKNKILVLILYVCYLPGLDMLSNATRGGLALSLGLPILVFTVVRNRGSRVFNFLPLMFHSSYLILAINGLLSKRFSGYRLNFFLFSFSIFFFIFWLVFPPELIVRIADGFSKEGSNVGKFARYLLLERELLSFVVKMYFVFVSVVFSLFYISFSFVNRKIIEDDYLSRLAFVVMSTQLLYAVVSFSEYSFRFMYLAYPIQVLMVCYIFENYFRTIYRPFWAFLLAFLGFSMTYTTKTFGAYELLYIF
ncbi:EpsG family protein [Pseudoalteromonas sp. SSDWG2]|uniref:EpsG family protein n=1 Tax=Pseudoalteromonas sp. SSDWG2 TaxID=3139391 RepID=UPI003BA85853